MNMSNTARVLSQQFFYLLLLSWVAFAGTLSPEFRTLPASRVLDVIVQYRHPGAGSEAAGSKLADIPGGAIYRMTAAQAAAAAAHPNVKAVSPGARRVYASGSAVPIYDF